MPAVKLTTKPYESRSKDVKKMGILGRSKAFVAPFALLLLLVSIPLTFLSIFRKTSRRLSAKALWTKPVSVQCENFRPIRSFQRREELGDILEEEGMKVGVELGVQRGFFSVEILRRWKSAERYVLVDVWAAQQHYNDSANEDDATQRRYMTESLSRTKRFADRGTTLEVCQDLTTTCARRYKPETFDFVYVDARHDYKGVSIDLDTWWPLLKPGGIMAGHSYAVDSDGPLQTGQNWSINFDGTVDASGRAVKGAVDDFFMAARNLQVVVAFRETYWNSWAVRKPTFY